MNPFSWCQPGWNLLEPRAVQATRVSRILAWAVVCITLALGAVYGTEWAAKGFRVERFGPGMMLGQMDMGRRDGTAIMAIRGVVNKCPEALNSQWPVKDRPSPHSFVFGDGKTR